MKPRPVCETCGGHANLRDVATYAGQADNVWPCPDCEGTGWAFVVCEHCGKPAADQRHPQWPAGFQPQGPDDAPPGFCNGIGCAPGAQGEAGEAGDSLALTTLRKYIQHVGEVEGVDFIPADQADQVRHVVNHFTPEELALLHELRRELAEKR
jgi:hypothetical protein